MKTEAVNAGNMKLKIEEGLKKGIGSFIFGSHSAKSVKSAHTTG